MSETTRGIRSNVSPGEKSCDVLGNYASYGALKRPNDSEPPKAIMQDTYCAAVDRLSDLVNCTAPSVAVARMTHANTGTLSARSPEAQGTMS